MFRLLITALALIGASASSVNGTASTCGSNCPGLHILSWYLFFQYMYYLCSCSAIKIILCFLYIKVAARHAPAERLQMFRVLLPGALSTLVGSRLAVNVSWRLRAEPMLTQLDKIPMEATMLVSGKSMTLTGHHAVAAVPPALLIPILHAVIE